MNSELWLRVLRVQASAWFVLQENGGSTFYFVRWFGGRVCNLYGRAAQSALQRDFADWRLHFAGLFVRDAGGAVHRRRPGNCLCGGDLGSGGVRARVDKR